MPFRICGGSAFNDDSGEEKALCEPHDGVSTFGLHRLILLRGCWVSQTKAKMPSPRLRGRSLFTANEPIHFGAAKARPSPLCLPSVLTPLPSDGRGEPGWEGENRRQSEPSVSTLDRV